MRSLMQVERSRINKLWLADKLAQSEQR